MNGVGWRTVVVESSTYVHVTGDRVAFKESEVEKTIPIEQLGALIIMAGKATVSASLIERLSQENIPIVFCDKKCTPVSLLLGFRSHVEAAGCQMDQASWEQNRKDAVWAKVVSMKIRQQYALLEKLGLIKAEELPWADKPFNPEEWITREGPVARMYFHRMFGENFTRFRDDNVNAALNYGYSIMSSAISRCIVSHGYTPVLGLHHCSRNNPLNLAYDLIEPFRPFVDQLVHDHLTSDFDRNYKKMLVELPFSGCLYQGRHMNIQTAIEMFTLDILKAMKDYKRPIGDVEFERSKECVDVAV